MKHTIYLTSGQTAEVITDGIDGPIEQGDSIYFEKGCRECARFKKECVAGISSHDERSYPNYLTPSEGAEWLKASITYDSSTLNRLLEKQHSRELYAYAASQVGKEQPA